MNVSQIYNVDDSDPVEMKIELEKKEARQLRRPYF